jgi:hypothetical protein
MQNLLLSAAHRLGKKRIALFSLVGLLGACAGTGQVARWEAEGDDVALRSALTEGGDPVRQAAADALVRYAAYETARPGIISTLRGIQQPEAKEALKQLYGVPTKRTPDPHGSGPPPGGAVLYLYRQAGDEGEARWLSADGRRLVRLQPGRFLRIVTSRGTHSFGVEMPDVRAALTDDQDDTGERMQQVAPMRFVVDAHTPGVYFVRYRALHKKRKPELKVMPVEPALRDVIPARPADKSDLAASE